MLILPVSNRSANTVFLDMYIQLLRPNVLSAVHIVLHVMLLPQLPVLLAIQAIICLLLIHAVNAQITLKLVRQQQQLPHAFQDITNQLPVLA